MLSYVLTSMAHFSSFKLKCSDYKDGALGTSACELRSVGSGLWLWQTPHNRAMAERASHNDKTFMDGTFLFIIRILPAYHTDIVAQMCVLWG